MTQRKSITKKQRFEVFKRDSFKCQYCGSEAPSAILEVDHINPVSKGGKNDLFNLITSCFDCNRGKSDRIIKDDSIINKQKKQIEELNIRRQQLEMMLEWRDGVKRIKDAEFNKCIDYVNSKFSDYHLSEHAESKIKKLVKKYGLIKCLDSFDNLYDKHDYLEESELLEVCVNKMGSYLNMLDKPQHIKDIAYIKGIIRNKFYINEKYANELLTEYHELGYSLEGVKDRLIRNEFRHWTGIKEFLENAIQEG